MIRFFARVRPEYEHRLIAAMGGVDVPGQNASFVDTVRESEAGDPANENPEKQKQDKERKEQEAKKKSTEVAPTGDEAVDAFGNRKQAAIETAEKRAQREQKILSEVSAKQIQLREKAEADARARTEAAKANNERGDDAAELAMGPAGLFTEGHTETQDRTAVVPDAGLNVAAAGRGADVEQGRQKAEKERKQSTQKESVDGSQDRTAV